jgi:hypothetical protein
MTRKEAFATAWHIVCNGVRIPVAGVTYGNRQEALQRLQKYEAKDIYTILVPEPENPYDPNAVAVKVGVQNGKCLYTIGYVPRTETATVHALLKSGKVIPRIRIICADAYSAQLSLEFRAKTCNAQLPLEF